MENLEYFQLNVNYYPSTQGVINPVDEKASTVWKGLQDYLNMLETEGWEMIKEIRSDKGQSRTYQFKRTVEVK